MLGSRALVRLVTSALCRVDEAGALAQLPPHTLLDSLYIYPYFGNYYGYLLLDKATKEIAAFDCGDFKACRLNVERVMKLEGAAFTHLFLTHEHAGHATGYREWPRIHPSLKIYSSAHCNPRLSYCTSLQDGTAVQVGCMRVQALHTPGHTPGSVSYLVSELGPTASKSPALFTGDTLLTGSIGKLADLTCMLASLQRLKSLPADCMLFPGHEVTLEALTFAKLLEPHNKPLNKKLAWAKERRSQNDYTVGSLLSEERLYNPFLRCDDPVLQRILETKGERETLERLWQLLERLVVG